MWLVFLLILFCILWIFSNIEIDLKNIDISKKSMNFKIIIYLNLLFIFKFEILKFDKYKYRFFFEKYFHNELKSKTDIKYIKNIIFEIIKKFNIKLKKANFVLKIGLIDMSLTNIAIVVFSSLFSIYLKNNYKLPKIQYKVFPNYNNFIINFQGNISVSFKTIKLIKYYFLNIKRINTNNKLKNYKVKESY